MRVLCGDPEELDMLHSACWTILLSLTHDLPHILPACWRLWGEWIPGTSLYFLLPVTGMVEIRSEMHGCLKQQGDDGSQQYLERSILPLLNTG